MKEPQHLLPDAAALCEDADTSTRYFDLFQSAPVGYLTISEDGVVQEANLAAGTLLGVSSQSMAGQPLSRFILKEDEVVFDLARKQLLADGLPQACELRMVKPDGAAFGVRLSITVSRKEGGPPWLLVVATDFVLSHHAERTLAFLARTSSGNQTEPFFNVLAGYLAEDLRMDFVCIDLLEGDGLTARTLAVWCDGVFHDNVSYSLKDTPCGELAGQNICCFPNGVSSKFPKDLVLQELRAESYIGTTLWSHDGKVIGLIALISRRPLTNRLHAEATLKLVAERAARELERQQTEELLRLNYERYRLTVQTAMDGFLLVDMRGRIVETNEAYCRMSGYSREELLKLGILDIDAVLDKAEVTERLETLKAHGEMRLETKHRRKDGTSFDAEVSIKYQPDEDGRAVSFIRDITQRKQSEAMLRESEARFRSYFELPAMGFAITSPEKGWIEVNDKLCQLLEYSRDELSSLTWSVLTHPDDIQADLAQFQRLLAGEVDSYSMEKRFIRKRSGSIWTYLSVGCVRKQDGSLKYALAALQDISKRYQMETALKTLATSFAHLSGRAFFEAVARHIATATKVDFVFVGEYHPKQATISNLGGFERAQVMRDFNYLLANTPFAEVVGKRVCHFPDRLRERFPEAAISKRLQAESFLGMPLFDKHQQPIGLLVAMHTGPLPNVPAITQLFEIFTERVTAEMQRANAEKALNQSIREKDFLLKEVHHRVKNNLQIVSSLMRLQRGQTDDPAVSSVLKDMQDRLRSMALIHEHLYRSEDLSRVDLSAYLRQLCQQLFRALAANSDLIRLNLDLSPVELDIDSAIPIGLLVNELVSNAIKYGFPDGRRGEVLVKLHTLPDGSGWHLRVADDGVGLPADFETKRTSSLGLQLIGDLVRQLGGRLEIGPGPGAVFDVEFKADRASDRK